MKLVLALASILLLSGCLTLSDAFKRVGQKPPPQLEVADSLVGLDERRDRTTLKEFLGIDPVRVEWCAAFVNSVLTEVGLPTSKDIKGNPFNSLAARSYIAWGKQATQPSPGDIMVFSRGSSDWKGHVGFYVATVNYRNKEYWVVLGGNQDNTVSYKLFATDTNRYITTRTLLDEPNKAILIKQQWMLSGIPLEFAED